MRPFAVVVVLIALLAAIPGAGAAPGGGVPLPQGWSLSPNGTEGGQTLSWRLARSLPMRDARVEFRDGDRVLGFPVQRGGTLSLPLPDRVIARMGTPSAWVGATRLDGPTPVQRFEVADEAPAPPSDATAKALTPAQDPGQRGRFKTATYSYELDPLNIEEYEHPVEVLAEVVAPKGAPGARPLVLFLHGRHTTCYRGGPTGRADGAWPCRKNWLPIPSHLGYRYAADLLASQGYITVSISANGINGQDYQSLDGGAEARSLLVRHHLKLWADWAAKGGDPWGGVFKGKVDLQRVVLIGHSRGGEGVERAAIDTRREHPWRIAGIVAIGPTTFGRQVGLGVPQAVILPYCDGDVADLQGQQLIDDTRDLGDDAALRSAVMMLGANHNFYNTEWTPGQAQAPSFDDWGFIVPGTDQTCNPGSAGRLAPEQQQKAGATYMAALVAAAVEHDEDAATLLDGSNVRAPSATPAVVKTHALGAARDVILRPGLDTGVTPTGMLARPCRGSLATDFGSTSECGIQFNNTRLPHWLGMYGADGAPIGNSIDLFWQRTGGQARIRLDALSDLSDAAAIELRVAVDPKLGEGHFKLRLVDAKGLVRTLPGTARLSPLPGVVVPLGKVWAQTARFPIAGVPGLDRSAIVALEVVPANPRGHIWLLDASAWRPGLAPVSRQVLPQVSIADYEVREADGPRPIDVPLEIEGAITDRATLWLEVSGGPGYAPSAGKRVTLEPGKDAYSVRLIVPGDRTFFPDNRPFTLVIKALHGVTTGRYMAAVTVLEDDPAPIPKLSIDDATVAEGESAVFRITLKQPATEPLNYVFVLRKAPGVGEIQTDDVPAAWLQRFVKGVPDPPVALRTVLRASFIVEPGETEATFEVPFTRDHTAEGDEGFTLLISKRFSPFLPANLRSTVTVTDAP